MGKKGHFFAYKYTIKKKIIYGFYILHYFKQKNSAEYVVFNKHNFFSKKVLTFQRKGSIIIKSHEAVTKKRLKRQKMAA